MGPVTDNSDLISVMSSLNGALTLFIGQQE